MAPTKLTREEIDKVSIEIAVKLSTGEFVALEQQGKELISHSAPIYKEWNFIYDKNADWLKYWFRCKKCQLLKYCFTSGGNAPMKRHSEQCSKSNDGKTSASVVTTCSDSQLPTTSQGPSSQAISLDPNALAELLSNMTSAKRQLSPDEIRGLIATNDVEGLSEAALQLASSTKKVAVNLSDVAGTSRSDASSVAGSEAGSEAGSVAGSVVEMNTATTTVATTSVTFTTTRTTATNTTTTTSTRRTRLPREAKSSRKQ